MQTVSPLTVSRSSLLVLFLLANAPGSASASQLIPYDPTPNAVASTTYTATVNGISVPVEKFGGYSYLRFAFTGTASIAVSTAAGTTISTAPISPLSYNITGTISPANKLSFSISQPRTLVVAFSLTSGPLEKLLVLADGPEINPPGPSGSGVINFDTPTYLSPTRNVNTAVTSQLQDAIDDTSALNGGAGGTLYIPTGYYKSGMVLLRSNVTLYLASGALLQATPVLPGGPEFPIQHGSYHSSFIYVEGENNVRITGRGIIDGNGYAIHDLNDSQALIKLVRTLDATNFVLEEVTLRNSCSWTVHPVRTDYATIRNIKILNNLLDINGGMAGEPHVNNADGIDPDNSTNVTIDGCFVYTGDDATSPKVTAYYSPTTPCHDLVIKNCVLRSGGAGMRVGTEAWKDLYNILFDNNDVIEAKYFIRLANQSAPSLVTKIYSVNVNNNRAETIGTGGFFNHSTIPEYLSPQWVTPSFYLGTVCPASGPSTVNGFHATARAESYSRMKGYDEPQHADAGGNTSSPIANFYVKNMYVASVPITGYDIQQGTDSSLTPLYYSNINTPTVTLTQPGGTPTVEVAATDAWSKESVTSGATEDTGTFTVSRMGSLAAALTVNYTLGGTAGGSEYTVSPASGSVTIPIGASQAKVTVSPKGDAASGEANETVVMTLTASGNYTLSTLSSATVSILDAPANGPTVKVTLQDGAADEGGANPGKFKLERTGATTSALTVNFVLSGSATNGTDYPNISSSATIPVGATYVTVQVDPAADGLTEGFENVILTLASGAYTMGSPLSGTVTITDTSTGGQPTVTVIVQDGSSAESNAVPHPNPGKFKLLRTGATTSALTVNFSLSGSATEGADYPNISHSATIPAGETYVIVQINPAAEGGTEPIENVILTLSNGSYTIGSPSSGTLTIAAN